MISVWICVCYKRSLRSSCYHSSIPLCKCIVKEQSRSLNFIDFVQTKLINPSKKDPPIMVKIYYVRQQEQQQKQKIKTVNNGFKLEMLTLSTHGDDQHRFMTSNSNKKDNDDDDDVIIHQEKQLLIEIVYSIRQTLELLDRPKRLLLFVNPLGGNKKGIKIFEEKVKPILTLSGVDYQSIITKRPNQAKDIILNNENNLSLYDGIICIGGDGMFGEVLNGVLIRTQLEHQINYDNIDASLKKPLLKLGIIPAGSTDAVVYATCGNKDPINSIIPIVLGRTINIDVGAVHHRDEEKLIRYTASFMGYGFFGDTILESERLRWMGPKRYDWAGLKNFFKHRLYSGEIKLCLEPNDGSPKDYNPCKINCPTCRHAGIKSRKKLSAEDSPACISIRGRFLAINSTIVSGRCEKSKHGMSPMAHVGNGCADLILVSKCSRFEYLRYLLSLAFHNRNPFDFHFIDSYRVREFEFNPIIEPHKRKSYAFEKSIDCDFFDAFEEESNEGSLNEPSDRNSSRLAINDGGIDRKLINLKKRKSKRKGCSLSSSIWNCDGEIVSDAAIHVKIYCQLVELYATGFDAERLLAENSTFSRK